MQFKFTKVSDTWEQIYKECMYAVNDFVLRQLNFALYASLTLTFLFNRNFQEEIAVACSTY